MPRPRRVDFEGAWHHVMNRGVAKQPIFFSDKDRRTFIDLLADATGQMEVEVHAYCLMGNHYHLLVRSQRGLLAEAMRRFSGQFTQSMNRRHGRDGPLFRGRYKSVRVATDRHLYVVSRYIHLNPVEAGLAVSAENWPWSSASAYLTANSGPSWLHTQDVLALFCADDPPRDYRVFLQDGVDEATRSFYGMRQLPSVFGERIYRPRKTQ